MSKTFIIGTRGSKLALFQSNLVKEKLEKNYPEYNFELKKIKTKGDIMIDQVLDRKIDKGFFVNEIQKMLINEDIHIAVHSLKDLPVENNEHLKLNAILKRANPQDVLISKNKKKLNDFNSNDIIGSSSLRRKAQLLKINPNLNIVDIRGNVDTRVSNEELIDITSSINDEQTKITTAVERLFMKSMGGGCNYPIAAYSYIKNDIIFLEGLVISLDGKNYIRSSAKESIKDWGHLSDKLSEKFFNQGVEVILNEIRNASS